MNPPPATRLGRPASGLPRYFMDCGWYRHPGWAGAPIEAIAVMEAIVGYCTEHASDGHVPSDPETLAAALGLRARDVRKALRWLTDHDKLDQADGQLVVPDWADRNPTKAEIEQASRARSVAGRRGNHDRWHARRGVVDPECEWCNPPDSESPPDRPSDRPPIAERSRKRSHGMGWDGMGVTTSSPTGSRAAAAEPGEPPGTDRGSELWARRLAARAPDLEPARARRELLTLAAANPGWSDQQLLDELAARNPA